MPIIDEIKELAKREYYHTGNPNTRNPVEIDAIRKVINQYGLNWVIVALIDGSIGYHTPTHARKILENLMFSKPDYCERCSACYKGDVVKMVMKDIIHLSRVNLLDKDSRESIKVVKMMENIEKLLKMSTISQLTLSMIYPTI